MKHRSPDTDVFFINEELSKRESLWPQGTDEDDSSTRIWIVTFADLVSLLLTFFIMLYAMSSISMEKWSKVTDNTGINRTDDVPGSENVETARYALAELLYKRAVDLRYLQAVLEETMKGDATLQGAHIKMMDNRLEVTLPVEFLFETEQTTIEPQGEKVLFNLGGVLRNISNKISIVSYFSPSSSSPGGASDWGMSLTRASVVASSLRKSGYNREMNIVGAMDTSSETRAPHVTIVILPGSTGG